MYKHVERYFTPSPSPRDTATNSTMKYPKMFSFEKARIRALFRKEHLWIFQQLNLLQCLGDPPSPQKKRKKKRKGT